MDKHQNLRADFTCDFCLEKKESAAKIIDEGKIIPLGDVSEMVIFIGDGRVALVQNQYLDHSAYICRECLARINEMLMQMREVFIAESKEKHPKPESDTT